MSVLPRVLAAALDPALRTPHTAPAADDCTTLCSRCCAEERLLRLARAWQQQRESYEEE